MTWVAVSATHPGGVTEWLGRDPQGRVCRFDSCPHLSVHTVQGASSAAHHAHQAQRIP